MQVTIRVRPEVARILHEQRATVAAYEELEQTTKDLGITLEPLHPGARDPLLAPYFVVEVPDTASAERVITRLHQCEAVEAAYLKPQDEAPGD